MILLGSAVNVSTGDPGTSPAFDATIEETSPVPTTLIADTSSPEIAKISQFGGGGWGGGSGRREGGKSGSKSY